MLQGNSVGDVSLESIALMAKASGEGDGNNSGEGDGNNKAEGSNNNCTLLYRRNFNLFGFNRLLIISKHHPLFVKWMVFYNKRYITLYI